MMRFSALALMVAAGALPAAADTYVVPPAYEHSPGTSTFLSPLAGTARTYQLLIHENQLTSLVGSDLNGLTFRLPGAASANWPDLDVTYGNWDVYLSASVPPENRSFTFAENVVGPQTQVRSGPLTILAGSFAFGGAPSAFGPMIEFDTPWNYAGGHLLVEIRQSGSNGTNRSVDAIGTSVTGYATDFSATWASGYEAQTGGLQGNFAIIQFATGPGVDPCYADCDANETLNIDDFLCFINEFSQAQMLPIAQQITHYANCDGSTNIPVLTIDDFLCFINEFSQGCP